MCNTSSCPAGFFTLSFPKNTFSKLVLSILLRLVILFVIDACAIPHHLLLASSPPTISLQKQAKEEQVEDLVVHVGKFSYKDPEFDNMMKPIVPYDMPFHYRNKMEFSIGPKRWLPKMQLLERSKDDNVYALWLHAPGFF
ncbi:hypothetical protein L2E82_04196 [Cichorium intybus]|uniref:Uncharacterized protein n=1 Tax=Cichorium intybus TaxID=13427 RepID=A0ACB9H527_CICIN|nr:hypothetical protein L2E82_04196 [Cichorium intybus]